MKDVTMKYIFGSILGVLAPVQEVIIVTFVLILVDLVSGIFAAKKRKEKIESSGLRRTITKIFVYQTAIITAFLVQNYLLGNKLPLCSIVAGVIGIVESTSIFENLNTIQGYNVFKKILILLGSPNDEVLKEKALQGEPISKENKKD